ncbi:Tetratrico peptide repeat protein [Streptomyces sp. YIM 121038]|uniref:tetratricopeptide repeat protein n=1 Tax=Streptomyces sp. YIM 121038 TaxID=2136401 RepID=UPI0011106E8C|nr:tetratricopeptide repeat protein [Streptomyces sp. YIM 121038]QCX80900.1 Tetratrico peptide repeat protein [Streptomyces sp. YIM 121038]
MNDTDGTGRNGGAEPQEGGAAPQEGNAEVRAGTGRDEILAQAVRLRESGRREEARALLLPLSESHPDDAEVAYQTAWVHDTLGLEAEALPHYLRAIQRPGLSDEDRRGALLGLGSTYRVLGKYPEAVAVLRDAVAEYPDDGALRTFLAMALYNTGRHHDAMALLLNLIATTSRDPEIAGYRPAIEYYAKDLDATL